MSETRVSYNGIGFFGLLTIIFITLKLCGVINWSWFWVLSPLWISFSLGLFIMVIVLGIFLYIKRHLDKSQ